VNHLRLVLSSNHHGTMQSVRYKSDHKLCLVFFESKLPELIKFLCVFQVFFNLCLLMLNKFNSVIMQPAPLITCSLQVNLYVHTTLLLHVSQLNLSVHQYTTFTTVLELYILVQNTAFIHL
jgi:hypothetical protein